MSQKKKKMNSGLPLSFRVQFLLFRVWSWLTEKASLILLLVLLVFACLAQKDAAGELTIGCFFKACPEALELWLYIQVFRALYELFTHWTSNGRARTIRRKKKNYEWMLRYIERYKKRMERKLGQSLDWDGIELVDAMSGHEFEHYCAALLQKNGFTDVQVTQASGDYGIDVLAHKDGISYAIQCKCYSGNVGNDAVQQAYSGKSYYNSMVAVVMTNRYFTQAAKETAARNQVLLWDRDVLNEMQHSLQSGQ